MLDNHIHIMPGALDTPEIFCRKTEQSGVEGGILIGLPPGSQLNDRAYQSDWHIRLAQLLDYSSHTPGFAPFFWIDPTETDAPMQVETACRQGIKGFKIICTHFFPVDGLAIYRLIAEKKLPILFHSGILWDRNVSAKFNRPAEFECLLTVPNLRFAMAHGGWPWSDEYLAVYGKFQQYLTNYPERNIRFFIDITPGTPPIYRREFLRKLYLAGYALEDRILWGTDCRANDYSRETAQYWSRVDQEILVEMEKDAHLLEFPGYPNWCPEGYSVNDFSATKAWLLASNDNIRHFIGI